MKKVLGDGMPRAVGKKEPGTMARRAFTVLGYVDGRFHVITRDARVAKLTSWSLCQRRTLLKLDPDISAWRRQFPSRYPGSPDAVDWLEAAAALIREGQDLTSPIRTIN